MWPVLVIALPLMLSTFQQPAPPVLSCQTISDRTTMAELQQRFGDLDAADRRLDVTWADANGTRMAAIWTVDRKSVWRAANGVKVGMAIADLDALNGRAFQLRNFEHENSGAVLSWSGGKLEASATGPCRIVVRLAPSVEEFTTLEWRLIEAIQPTADVSSDDRRIKPFKAVVSAVGLDWR